MNDDLAVDTPCEEDPIVDVTQDGALPPPPYTARPDEPAGDAWLDALRTAGDRVSVYTDSAGRRVTLAHPGLVPPPAIFMAEGVPASPVEFTWRGDE